jgi:Domain of Unknown Function with PDB structure (DUF3857)/Transglutaminase-like superfamily
MPLIRRAGLAFVLGLSGIFLHSPAHCEDWLPIAAADLQMTREPKAPGAAAIYLYRQEDRDDTIPGVSIYVRLKILSEEGRKYADVEIPFAKGIENVHGIDARTIRPDGSIVRFDGAVYEKPILNARGVKLLAKTFTMPDVQVGSIIEYRYRHEDQRGFVFDSHWILSQDLFMRDAKFSLLPYPYFSLAWSWPRGLPADTTTPVKERDRIRLEAHDVPAFVSEELMPPENELKFRVDFIYSEEKLEKDPDQFWKHYASHELSSLRKFLSQPKAMERAVAQIVQPTDSPEAKLRKIYARVQQMHNLTFERKKSEQEEKRDKQTPAHDVEDVWNRGSGDAFELTYLFVALARATGLQADVALVSTRDRYFFNPRLMNPRELNSNLAIVTLDGNDRYLDAGVPFIPFGLLPWYETGVQGLRLDERGGSWLTTPLPAPAASRIERTAQLKLDDQGTLTGKVTLRFSGLEGAWRRAEERNEDDTDRKQFLEDELRNSVPSGVEVALTNQPDWTVSEAPLLAEYTVKVPGWAAAAGQRQLLKVGLFCNEDDHTFEHSTRTHPMYFDFPFQHVDDVSIEMPAGRRIGSLPKGQQLGSKFFSYDLTAENQDGRLHVKRDILVNLLLLDVKYYGQLRDFYQTVRSADEEQAVVTANAAVAQR